MNQSKIQWTDVTWNPVRGGSRGAQGHPSWTGKVELVEKHLNDPLHWLTPKRVFVNSMSDLFHEALPDDAIDRVFAVMALCPQHTFQVLTKRAKRMHDYLSSQTVQSRIDAFQWGIIEDRVDPAPRRFRRGRLRSDDLRAIALDPDEDWPLPNIWLGVSAEDQENANERIPWLLKTPAAVRFVSYEPALAAVNFTPYVGHRTYRCGCGWHDTQFDLTPEGSNWRCLKCRCIAQAYPALDLIIVGGESGPGARPFDVQWARDTIEQCKAAGVACFVKQLGAKPHDNGTPWHLADRKGGNINEWPPEFRVLIRTAPIAAWRSGSGFSASIFKAFSQIPPVEVGIAVRKFKSCQQVDDKAVAMIVRAMKTAAGQRPLEAHEMCYILREFGMYKPDAPNAAYIAASIGGRTRAYLNSRDNGVPDPYTKPIKSTSEFANAILQAAAELLDDTPGITEVS